MKKSPLTFTALILMAFLAMGTGGGSGGCSQNRLNIQAPDFTLQTLQDPNQLITLSEVNRDHPVLLIFWATWCRPCVAEIPELNRLQHEFEHTGLKIIGVNAGESRNRVADFAKDHEMNFTCLLDLKGQVISHYHVDGLPTAVLLAKGGTILYYGFQLPEDLNQLISESENQ
ncbi:MAG: TlpA family protein disulfide reductase [Candidatus Omnitrophica bacterium]|nr:TlpA family protein disulfide reductase [Candidatus Omnitrophota bacterium]